MFLALIRRKHWGLEAPDPTLLPIRCTAKQEAAVREFHDLLFGEVPPPAHRRPDEEYDSKLDSLLHGLSEAVLYQDLPLNESFACPSDFLLMLRWLTEDGSPLKGSQMSKDCAAFQYWARATGTHSLRLTFAGLDAYQRLLPSSPPRSGIVVDDEDARDSQVR
jgi:hypothetical protein